MNPAVVQMASFVIGFVAGLFCYREFVSFLKRRSIKKNQNQKEQVVEVKKDD